MQPQAVPLQGVGTTAGTRVTAQQEGAGGGQCAGQWGSWLWLQAAVAPQDWDPRELWPQLRRCQALTAQRM